MNWCIRDCIFNMIKTDLYLLRPLKGFTFPRQFMKWSRLSRKVGNEMSVVLNHTQEVFDFHT
uniref:Uncharacterized protein n=1 Tax=Lepeophtheirus salmonis TaxID=72036 RepID=A0A0K2T4T4_LEPSM